MFNMLAQEVIGPAPQVQGLSPTLQFVLTLVTLLVPLLIAILKARSNGKVADTVIAGVESAAEEIGDSPEMKALIAKASRGEPVTKDDLGKLGLRLKTEIKRVAIEEGTEAALAPRVQKVTGALEPAELAKRLLAPPLILFMLLVPGCASVKLEHVEKLEQALLDERKAVEIRPGFVAVVEQLREKEDEVLAQMKAACR